ncbi:MAG: hypothetical protein AAGB15_03430 [Pseudomonadota bacterium]
MDEELTETLKRARKILADTSALLELEIDKLFDTEVEEDDKARIKDMKSMIQHLQHCWRQVLDIEAKSGLTAAGGYKPLDLEAARDEILGRLARLADRGQAQSVPG